MKRWFALLLLFACSIHGAELPAFTAGTSAVQFPKLPQQAGAEELKLRLHSIESPAAIDLAAEKFQVIVPTAYQHSEPWGVFIWISPGDAPTIPAEWEPPPRALRRRFRGDAPTIPAEWEPVLAARKLLFVGAFKAGNPRNIFDRMRLAIAANTGMRDRFNVDGRRVYVSGFSGGGRVASMLGVAYADMFSGAAPFMGVNFYEDIAASDGKTYGANFIPDGEVLAIAKKSCRYALVTGGKDFNRAGTKAVFDQGYRKEGFANVLYLEAPGIAHAMPPALWLERSLEFLDKGKGMSPVNVK